MKNIVFLASTILLCSCSVSHELPRARGSSAQTASPPVSSDLLALKQYPINVTLQGVADFHDIDGEAPFEQMTVSLSPGKTLFVSLKKAGSDFFNSTVSLQLNYKQGELWIDGESLVSTTPFTLTEAWLQGKEYKNVYTHGNAALRDSIVTIQLKQ